MNGPSIRQELVSFAQAGKVLEKNQDRAVAKLCEVSKEFLKRKAKAFVSDAARRPILYTYAADGTPMRLSATFRTHLADGTPVVRRGGFGHELLIQRGYLITKSDLGERKSAVILRDPVPLYAGKGAWNCLTAAASFFPILRTIGHESITVTHGCFDRALHTALSRLLAKRQVMYYDVAFGEGEKPGYVKKQMREYSYAHTARGTHDCQTCGEVGCYGFRP